MIASRARLRPDLAAALVLSLVYGATLARGVTFWDAGEFLAAIHSLGIPHPPGTPLFILTARVWADVVAPIAGFTIAVNAFSAMCTAAAFGLIANLFWRWTGRALPAFCAAVTPGLMSTAWLNATETEVYACALALSFILLWCSAQAADAPRTRVPAWLLLLAYLCGLAWALHLTALLTLPAALALLWGGSARLRVQHNPGVRFAVYALVLALVGASPVLFLLIRAAHDPAVNQGNPATLHALVDVVQRHQYDVAPMWPRRAPLWLQIGNIFEYADWQVALGLSPEPPPSFARTGITIMYVLLAVYGSAVHRRFSRTSWTAWLALLLGSSIGVVLYLNLRAGASFGVGIVPPTAAHEARDRDYFFTWFFVAWGAWAGLGAAAAATAVSTTISRLASAERRPRRIVPPLFSAIATTIALLPGVLDWSAVVAERRDSHAARLTAERLLGSVPHGGILLAIGDNDTYPLWYMQQVVDYRNDVTVVTAPLLGAQWYRQELARRHRLLDPAFVRNWLGIPATVADVRARAALQGRDVVQSPGVAVP